MKKIIILVVLGFMALGVSAQEKRIKFNKGVIKICTSSPMEISGYDGDEVIIKNLSKSRSFLLSSAYRNQQKRKNKPGDSTKNTEYRLLRLLSDNDDRRRGLKSLGKNGNNYEDLFLNIEQKNGELIIKDFENNGQSYFVSANTRYELLIPNSLKLNWNTEGCKKSSQKKKFFVVSKPYQIKNFKGDVEISSSYGSIILEDVTGPVLANSLGGNIEAFFNNSVPKGLYSLVSNDGFIDIHLPASASLSVNATANEILSDLDFEVVTENITEDGTNMNLKLNNGKIKMKLDAGYGNIYLRKK